MKVFLKKQTNIIDVPENNVANLLELTPDGNYFKYEVTYRADPRKAVQNSALTVRILATIKPFTKQGSKIFTGNNPDQLIKNVLQKSSTSKDQSRSQLQNVFFTKISDISSRIPNNKTNLLGLNPAVGKLIPNVTFSSNKSLKLKSVAEIDQENISLPVLENNISTMLVPNMVRNAVVSKAVMSNLANQKYVDPAQISGAKTNTIQSAKKVSGGMISMPTKSIGKFNLNDTQKISLLGNLVNTANPSNHTQLQPSDFLNVLVNQPRSTIDMVETLFIPVGFLQIDEFFLVFQLVDDKGVEVQTINVTVPHARNLAALQIPVIPPLVEVLQTGLPGKNVIQVKQLDKSAVGCAVYRKELKKGIPVSDSSFTFIGNIAALSSQDFQRMEDIVNNFNPIIYRVIPFNDNNVLSAEFSSAGSAPIKMPGKGRFNRRRNFASVVGEVLDDSISIEIRDIPPGVILVELYRKDLSFNEQEFTLATKPKLITNEETLAPIFINDTDVKKNRIYEYQVKLLMPDGNVETASSNLIIKFNPVTANIVSTTISKPVVVQTGTDLDVTFTLESSIIPGNLDSVKAALESQGLIDFFTDEILSERENLQNIIAYSIQRHNLSTGEVEDFGVVTTKTFSDRTLGKVKGVRNLESGYEYRYSVTTFFRAAETTLLNLERTVTLNSNQSYTFKPSKWLHPITLSEGNITSVKSLKRNHSESTFSFGSVGSISTTTVSLADILPSVVEAKAKKLSKNSGLVQWRVQGNINKIDHFLIILEIMGGMRTVVGKCHNISDTNFFQFVDMYDNNEHGKLVYFIVPVFYDYSRGTETATNEVMV